MPSSSRTALLTVALATAASATVLSAPAGAAGTTSYATVQLRTALQTVSVAAACDVDEDGKPTNCTYLTVGAPTDSVTLRMDYTLLRGQTQVPAVESAAGMLPKAACPPPPVEGSGLQQMADKPGARVVASGAQFQDDSSLTLVFEREGQPPKHHTVTKPASPHDSVPRQGKVVCLF